MGPRREGSSNCVNTPSHYIKVGCPRHLPTSPSPQLPLGSTEGLRQSWLALEEPGLLASDCKANGKDLSHELHTNLSFYSQINGIFMLPTRMFSFLQGVIKVTESAQEFAQSTDLKGQQEKQPSYRRIVYFFQ